MLINNIGHSSLSMDLSKQIQIRMVTKVKQRSAEDELAKIYGPVHFCDDFKNSADLVESFAGTSTSDSLQASTNANGSVGIVFTFPSSQFTIRNRVGISFISTHHACLNIKTDFKD